MRNSINSHQDPFHNHWNSLMPFPFHWVSACRLVSLQAGIHINFVMGLTRLLKTHCIPWWVDLFCQLTRCQDGDMPPCKDKQGKSEGFESCDRPIVRKRPIWVKIGDVLSRVTSKFDGWPWKTIGHLSFAVSSFVQHFIAICEFKLELLSWNAQFGSNSTIFRAVWPWNLTCGLEKQ